MPRICRPYTLSLLGGPARRLGGTSTKKHTRTRRKSTTEEYGGMRTCRVVDVHEARRDCLILPPLAGERKGGDPVVPDPVVQRPRRPQVSELVRRGAIRPARDTARRDPKRRHPPLHQAMDGAIGWTRWRHDARMCYRMGSGSTSAHELQEWCGHRGTICPLSAPLLLQKYTERASLPASRSMPH